MTSKQGAALHASRWDENSLPVDLCTDKIEQRIIRAYIQLVFRPDNADGSRSVMVMRSGSLEVRLTELPPNSVGRPPRGGPGSMLVHDWLKRLGLVVQAER